MRQLALQASFGRAPIVVNLFAGGGGTSVGIDMALGPDSVDIAINHDPAAIAMHQVNHPRAQHFISDVWEVAPKDACRGRRVGLLWLSPDCTFFSRAKGGKPRDKKSRSLAYVGIRWARDVKPDVIILENVVEFLDWGPLLADGTPDKTRKGRTFKIWLGKLRALGYVVEWRKMVAADYGAPTTRERLFLVARRDGNPIVWPTPTHAEDGKGPRRWRSAASIIDWSVPVRSIFGRKKPLAEATMKRIAEGVRRYVLKGEPFIMPLTHPNSGNRTRGMDRPLPTVTSANRGELALVAPLLVKTFGGPNGATNRGLDVREPLGTVTTQDHHCLVSAFLTKFYGTNVGAPLSSPLPTVTANNRGGGHLAEVRATLAHKPSAEVRAFLVKYFGATTGQHQPIGTPLHTVTCKARFGLVIVKGEPYHIVDIGLRMLKPRELFSAQSFPKGYVIDFEFRGKPMTITAQTHLAGNSVCPEHARAVVGANVPQFRTAVA